ncbi:MAG: NTP transferase domain-containing protein [Chloroflexi bacterium]|nr:NTP transferase domain-containing protein [Chloroflexota bacterium]
MYAVILAGGGGTRLWPLSRVARPKPFLPLLGGDSLLQRTVARLSPLVQADDIYLVTDERHGPLVREQLPDVPAANLVLEPVGRNTAAAVALAALIIERPEDEVMLVLPADHRVTDEAALRRALGAAGSLASEGRLVTLGIRATLAETGYGYIVASGAGERREGLPTFTVERFVEKPSPERAEELLAGGRALWNAGIFLWRRDAVREGLRRHAPHVTGPLEEGLAAGRSLAEIYPHVPATSIDYALLEPASVEGAVSVVPADVGWSDVGSWAALLDARAEEGGPRRVVGDGETMDEGSEDVLVHSAGGRLVVTVGLRGTIVVDTPDVVLVCAREQAQDVRRVVDRLVAAKESDHL